jgi:hypothetical protein
LKPFSEGRKQVNQHLYFMFQQVVGYL